MNTLNVSNSETNGLSSMSIDIFFIYVSFSSLNDFNGDSLFSFRHIYAFFCCKMKLLDFKFQENLIEIKAASEPFGFD